MNTTPTTTSVDDPSTDDSSCEDPPHIYMSSLGIQMAVPEWEAAMTAATLSLLILLTIVGNILVILSVFTYKPLRIVQNFFIVSLAVADLTVAVLVMPFNVAYSILGRWEFGIHTCKMWLTCDVLCCTASILNLCAIALDRYWAITDPINYAQKRTLKRVLMMIAGIWILSLIISSPPLIGWNDWPKNFSSDTPCQLTSQKGYVIYSSLGSFYIPLVIMTIVYIEIFIATRRRLRERAKASKINTILSKNAISNDKHQHEAPHDQDSVSSETNHADHSHDITTTSSNGKQKIKKHKKKRKKSTNAGEHSSKCKLRFLTPILPAEDSVTDVNQENSSSSNQRKNSAGLEDGGNSAATPLTTTTTSSPIPRNMSHREHVTSSTMTTTTAEPIVISTSSQIPSVITTMSTTTTTAATSLSKKSGAVYQFIEEKQRISLSKERRAARTLGIIMGVFVVCWLPFFLMYVILPFCPSCCATKKFINFITWLGYINSALNPIIYTIFNLEYRRAFKKLLGIKV